MYLEGIPIPFLLHNTPFLLHSTPFLFHNKSESVEKSFPSHVSAVMDLLSFFYSHICNCFTHYSLELYLLFLIVLLKKLRNNKQCWLHHRPLHIISLALHHSWQLVPHERGVEAVPVLGSRGVAADSLTEGTGMLEESGGTSPAWSSSSSSISLPSYPSTMLHFSI